MKCELLIQRMRFPFTALEEPNSGAGVGNFPQRRKDDRTSDLSSLRLCAFAGNPTPALSLSTYSHRVRGRRCDILCRPKAGKSLRSYSDTIANSLLIL